MGTAPYMTVPAMVLYEGAAMLKQVDPHWRDVQQKEIHAATPELTKELGFIDPNDDFQTGLSLGIELGLAAARTVIAGSMEVIQHGADPAKIL